MKIEVGKTYVHKGNKKEEVTVDSLIREKDDLITVSFKEDYGNLRLMNSVRFEHEYTPIASEPSKPAHYDTAIDTIAFAKANFSREQVEGFMRINAIKYLQRAGKKDDKLSDLRKSAHYLQMLIEMEEGK